ncbi:hypothetical protein ACJX0J_007135, partial [Zea mays]
MGAVSRSGDGRENLGLKRQSKGMTTLEGNTIETSHVIRFKGIIDIHIDMSLEIVHKKRAYVVKFGALSPCSVLIFKETNEYLFFKELNLLVVQLLHPILHVNLFFTHIFYILIYLDTIQTNLELK